MGNTVELTGQGLISETGRYHVWVEAEHRGQCGWVLVGLLLDKVGNDVPDHAVPALISLDQVRADYGIAEGPSRMGPDA